MFSNAPLGILLGPLGVLWGVSGGPLGVLWGALGALGGPLGVLKTLGLMLIFFPEKNLNICWWFLAHQPAPK